MPRRKRNLLGLVLIAVPAVIAFHSAYHPSPGSPAANQAVLVGSSEASWIGSLLTALGDPHTQANENSVAHWIRHETAGWPPADGGTVVNNPMNTSQPEPGSTVLNSAGVRIYPDLAEGLQATVATLENGRYADILSQLRSGAGLTSGASSGLSTWSNGAYGSV